MSEFCLDCLNKLDGTQLTEADVILQDDLCEECGKVVPCVVLTIQRWKKYFGNCGTSRKRTLTRGKSCGNHQNTANVSDGSIEVKGKMCRINKRYALPAFHHSVCKTYNPMRPHQFIIFIFC